MKRILILLLAGFTLLLGMSSCRMRYEGRHSHQMTPKDVGHRTKRHYGAKKTYKQRREIWGRKHYGPRPYRHRGRQRY